MDLQILYLQSEQRKRREELDAIERDLAKIIANFDKITSSECIKRIEDPALRKKMQELARNWKRTKKAKDPHIGNYSKSKTQKKGYSNPQKTLF